MNQLNEAVKALHEIDLESGKRRKNTDIHPLSILLVTICYIGVTSSFGNYDMQHDHLFDSRRYFV